MKRVAKTSEPAVVVPIIVVAVDVHVALAVPPAEDRESVQEAFRATASRLFDTGCILFEILNSVAFLYQVSSIFDLKCLHEPLFFQP